MISKNHSIELMALSAALLVIGGCDDSFPPTGPNRQELVGAWTANDRELPGLKLTLSDDGKFELVNAKRFSGSGKWEMTSKPYPYNLYRISLIYGENDNYIVGYIIFRGVRCSFCL